MREICTSGSEGGGADRLSLPLSRFFEAAANPRLCGRDGRAPGHDITAYLLLFRGKGWGSCPFVIDSTDKSILCEICVSAKK